MEGGAESRWWVAEKDGKCRGWLQSGGGAVSAGAVDAEVVGYVEVGDGGSVGIGMDILNRGERGGLFFTLV